MLPKIENRDYETHFWNAMRGKAINRETLNNGVEPTTDAYTLSPRGQETFISAIKEESIFRNLAADMRIYDHDSRIKTVSTDDVAVWVPEGGSIPIQTGIGDFSDITIAKHKITVFLKLENTLVCDPFSILRIIWSNVWLKTSVEQKIMDSSMATAKNRLSVSSLKTEAHKLV